MLKKWEATDSEVDKLVGDVLKYAPSRKGGGGRHRSSDVHLFIEVELFVLVSSKSSYKYSGLLSLVCLSIPSVHTTSNDVVLTLMRRRIDVNTTSF